MVEKEYGVTSGIQYLEKFYRLRIGLPVSHTNHQGRQAQYLDHLLREMGVRMDDPRTLELVAQGLDALAATYNLPLRTLEQVAGNVALVCLATNQRYFRLAPLIAGLCAMRILDPALYEKARTGRLAMNEAVRFLRFDEWSTSAEWHKGAWIYATATDDELDDPKHEAAKQWGRAIYRFNMTRQDMVKATCRQIDDLWQREPA